MFKLVVLTALFAAAAAEPGLLAPLGYSASLGYSAPLAYSSVVSPGVTTIAQQASSVVHPSPISYSAPLTYSHFIKKRSAPAFFAPSTYIAGSPLATAYSTPYAYSAPGLVHSASILPAAPLPYATHFIKKRSAPLLHSAVIPTAYAQPLLTSPYAATPLLHSAQLVNSVPLISQPIITPHFIKKRSAPLLTPYIAPAAFSSQSRIDYTHSSPLISTSYSAPLTYSSPLAYSHVF